MLIERHRRTLTRAIQQVILLSAMTVGTLPPAHADLTFRVKEYPMNVAVEIHVAGEIRKKDTQDLDSGLAAAKQFANARKKSMTSPHFILNSPGGDVAAGAIIGRWARTKEASAEVENECSSACVLILAGAIIRRDKTGGKIGIHRIYFSNLNPTSTYRQVREKMADVDQFLAAYLREMDVPISLLEEMKSVPPDQVRYLSALELQRYRLVGADPAYQEQSDTQEAARYGLSREEFYRRKSRADSICREGTFLDLDCWETVIVGKK